MTIMDNIKVVASKKKLFPARWQALQLSAWDPLSSLFVVWCVVLSSALKAAKSRVSREGRDSFSASKFLTLVSCAAHSQIDFLLM